MNQTPISCANCGAIMQPEADGRTYACGYCRTRIQVAIDGRQIAAGLAVDLSNIESFLEQLAFTLSQGFSEHTTIERDGKKIELIEIDLESDRFIARREGRQVVSEQKKMVRGIALKTHRLSLDQWFEALTNALAQHANASARAAWVLARITGRG
jgi:hypothetical protein